MTRDSLRRGPKPLLRRGIGTRSGSSGCAERRWSVNQSAVRSIVPSIDAPQTLQVRTTIGRGWLVATARSVRSHWPLIFTIAASVASALRANSLNSLRIARRGQSARSPRVSVCGGRRVEGFGVASIAPPSATGGLIGRRRSFLKRRWLTRISRMLTPAQDSSSVRMSCRGQAGRPET
jgi:hypothetical protein